LFVRNRKVFPKKERQSPGSFFVVNVAIFPEGDFFWKKLFLRIKVRHLLPFHMETREFPGADTSGDHEMVYPDQWMLHGPDKTGKFIEGCLRAFGNHMY